MISVVSSICLEARDLCAVFSADGELVNVLWYFRVGDVLYGLRVGELWCRLASCVDWYVHSRSWWPEGLYLVVLEDLLTGL